MRFLVDYVYEKGKEGTLLPPGFLGLTVYGEYKFGPEWGLEACRELGYDR